MKDNSLSNRDGTGLNRRQFIGVGGGAGVVLLAGCLGDDSPTDGNGDDGPDESEEAGTFRLLISDQPVAIDEFDSLEVTLDRARVFGTPAEENEDGTEAGDDNGGDDNGGDNGGNDDNGDDDGSGGDNGDDDGDEDSPGQRGFFFIDLDSATVDLTEVIGEKAIEVFEGELPAGEYNKIELYPEDVEGIVDDEEVTVHVPSDKLQIVTSFEVEAGEELSFVFDINVVRRGQTGEYNLTPVISGSGVAGEDVEVEEIDPEDDGSDDDGEDDGSDDDDDDGEDDGANDGPDEGDGDESASDDRPDDTGN